MFSTLSGSGHKIFDALERKFNTVIVDEATQAVELSTLIPFRHGCSKAILIGDPNQLPATVISNVAAAQSYEQSLFQRLQMSGYPMSQLNVQYRMNPEIARFPSMHFYQNKLKNGENTKAHVADFHREFKPFMFFNVHSRENSERDSIKNVEEARALVSILSKLLEKYPAAKQMTIGIVTPYRRQVYELSNQLKAKFGELFARSVFVNTVDGFQGSEKDIILFSCVRSHTGRSIGFLADVRRMNVALTRARYLLLVVGNARSLCNNPEWEALVKEAKERRVCKKRKKFIHFLTKCRPGLRRSKTTSRG